MKFTRKLIPAFVMLLVSAVLLSTSSFAWFSLNDTVSVTGIQVTAVAPASIFISDAAGGDYKATAKPKEEYAGKLLPASSVDGKSFVALTGGDFGNGVGGVVTQTGAEQNKGRTFGVVSAKPTGAGDIGYYQDYTVFVKMKDADTSSSTFQLYIDSIDIVGDDTLSIKNTIRVAAFSGEGGVAGGDAMGIYTLTGVSGRNAQPLTNATPTLGSTETIETLGACGGKNTVDLDKTGVTPTQITFRVWIEGQDADCVNAKGGASVTLKFNFGLNETPAVAP